jgi:sarcosine oxidase subunit gamma
MADLIDCSPLTHNDERLGRPLLSGPGVTLAEMPREGLILLRGPEKVDFLDQAEKLLGHSLPTKPNRVASTDRGAGQQAALWLRPGGWLLRCPLEECSSLIEKLDKNLEKNACLALDVSHQYLVINIAGAKARELLSKTCPLNLNPGHFTKDHCAATLLGEILVILQQISDTPSYDLFVEQSLARFTWWWLQELTK